MAGHLRGHAREADEGELQLQVEAEPVERHQPRVRTERRRAARELRARGGGTERAAAEEEALQARPEQRHLGEEADGAGAVARLEPATEDRAE